MSPHRHCERSEAIQSLSAVGLWIASSLLRKIATQFCRELLAMTSLVGNPVPQIPLSFPAKAGNPVRRGVSAESSLFLEYWIAGQA
jgi:hypothetical protein